MAHLHTMPLSRLAAQSPIEQQQQQQQVEYKSPKSAHITTAQVDRMTDF